MIVAQSFAKALDPHSDEPLSFDELSSITNSASESECESSDLPPPIAKEKFDVVPNIIIFQFNNHIQRMEITQN